MSELILLWRLVQSFDFYKYFPPQKIKCVITCEWVRKTIRIDYSKTCQLVHFFYYILFFFLVVVGPHYANMDYYKNVSCSCQLFPRKPLMYTMKTLFCYVEAVKEKQNIEYLPTYAPAKNGWRHGSCTGISGHCNKGTSWLQIEWKNR